VVGVVDVETGKVNIEINHVLHQMLYNNCRKRKCESGGELGQMPMMKMGAISSSGHISFPRCFLITLES